jgi:hypothetical protein
MFQGTSAPVMWHDDDDDDDHQWVRFSISASSKHHENTDISI